MDTMTFLQMFALIYLGAGIAILLGAGNFKKAVDDLTKPGGLALVTGMMSLIFGAAIVTLHNRWNTGPEILVSLFGWLAILKGLLYMACPDCLKDPINAMMKNEAHMKIWGVAMIIIGAALYAWANGWI